MALGTSVGMIFLNEKDELTGGEVLPHQSMVDETGGVEQTDEKW